MLHNVTDERVDLTLQQLRLFASESEIRITTIDTQSILCGTGTFSIAAPHASLTVARDGADSGTIDLRTSGPNADIVLEADSTADCVSLLTLNKEGILGVFGPPLAPAFIDRAQCCSGKDQCGLGGFQGGGQGCYRWHVGRDGKSWHVVTKK